MVFQLFRTTKSSDELYQLAEQSAQIREFSYAAD
jgi:hypothetical protein